MTPLTALYEMGEVRYFKCGRRAAWDLTWKNLTREELYKVGQYLLPAGEFNELIVRLDETPPIGSREDWTRMWEREFRKVVQPTGDDLIAAAVRRRIAGVPGVVGLVAAKGAAREGKVYGKRWS